MNMESPPQVPVESRVLRIPAFFKISPYSQEIPSEMDALCDIRTCYRTKSEDIKLSPTCKCPQVLISDDDPFQEFFYLSLFKKMIDRKELPKDFRLSVFRSGEELLKKYSATIQHCDCRSCLLIITDFNMGREKLNGVETASGLRRLGYQGPILLRTSEKEEDLDKIYPNFKKLLENKTINNLDGKNDLSKIRELLRNFLKK